MFISIESGLIAEDGGLHTIEFSSIQSSLICMNGMSSKAEALHAVERPENSSD